ncbi:uncharacterized protein LOC124151794 isoform X2 [Haliotis rufescens]|uniref:uncharacterized protein LOC124151794 isoform X2 n=1 Tax=Haliotis rufescens TaxID=6454 RepID=UPI00201F6048|nr:uncharacterized protein LOC124151794 isoform X2 [Haliotis rufescens]
MELEEIYQPSTNDKVTDLEKDLRTELADLKSELEENEIIHGISPKFSVSSVPIPSSVEHFRRERKMIIKRAMQVSEAQPLRVQADLMKTEMMNAEAPEYTPQSLPLLLHQYFTERIQQLVQCKHLHMLRWKRFCEHTSTIEALYPLYQKKLSHILNEYHDCVQRAQRLSVARESLLEGKDTPITAIKMEDLLIYLRWLICNLHSVKQFNQYLRVLQWLPVSHQSEIAPPDMDKVEQEEITGASRFASRYDDGMGLFPGSRPRSGPASRPSSAASSRSLSTPIPAPPPINLTLLSTNPLASSSMLYAAAASGGGLASDEHNLCLPRHVTDFDALKPQLAFLVNIYGIQFDLDSIRSTADEMELFAAINRRFKHIFIKQEHMNTFKMYDRVEGGQDAWGSDSPNHALLKDANWQSFITLKSNRDSTQEKRWTQLRQTNNVDEVLRVQAHFLHVTDAETVQDTLRQQAGMVRDPPHVQAASVTSHRTRSNTTQVWKKIYSNPDLYTDAERQDQASPQDFDERELENVNFSGSQARASSARKRKDSYDYVNTVQMLGLDEGEHDQSATVNIQGAYLSFLQLRHLRLRDLRRSCLSIMNYFRSIERTLTINDGGLSHESGNVKRQSPQNHRRNTETEGTVGGGGGLGSHSYLHNTPADFKMSESEFIEFSEVENHDDFYTIEEGRIHVVDQRGYYIMYDMAVSDVENREKDFMLIATHFIEKDRDLRIATRIKLSESSRRRSQNSAGDFDIESYAHQELDRFGVMLDLWSNEASFLECKRELLDCYFEAYQHVFDRDERRSLAQVITDIIHKQPRFDFSSAYFVKTYRAECVLLRQQATLVKTILDKQIEEQREYTQRVCRDGDTEFGLPYRIVPKQPVSINLSRPALKNVFMLEFHPTLAVASRIPEALEHAFWELIHIHKPETVFDTLMMEKKLLEVAQREWDRMENMGASYSPQLQKDLFSDVYCDDPLFLCEIAQSLVTQQDQEGGSRRSTKEKQLGMVNVLSRVMETVTLRSRLMDAAWETEILSKIYRQQASEMNFPDCHMYLRPIQFEFASFKDNAKKPPPIFITSVQGDESSFERYTPQNNVIFLAIHELDEGQVGRFSFRSRDGILQILRPGGMENLQVVLKAQTVHKNALISAVQQANVCQPVRQQDWKSGRASPTETKSEKSSMTQFTSISSGTGGTGLASKHQSETGKHRRSPEAFISMQLEKRPSRDLMLNDYIQKKQQMGTVLRNPEEQEKLKRRLISEYCMNFSQRVSQYSLRGQIIAYYNSVLRLLEDFPAVRDTYFMRGEVNEKKMDTDDLKGMVPDAKVLKTRPRRLLSPDGRHVLNLWFIPHHTEVLIMFKTMDDSECVRALQYTLAIVAAQHDMLHYLCAHSRLGSSHARLGSQKMEFVSADWGGTEGIGAELREIQKQINNLPDPTNPGTVVEFLTLRRDVMFLEFDTAVRHYMADTFLSTGNQQGFQAITENMYHALPALSNVQRTSLTSAYLSVPEPLEPRDLLARKLYPWRSFVCQNGPHPLMFWQWQQIDFHIQGCLAGLKDVDRHVANGEILGVTLLMEDVLQTGYQDTLLEAAAPEDADVKSIADTTESRCTSAAGESREGKKAAAAQPSKSLSRTQQPMDAYRLLKSFLKLWKCLELAKVEWGRRKLIVERIETHHLYKEYCKLYRMEVLLPVLQSVARRLGQGDLYEGLVLDTDILVMPKGASEIEVRAKQLVRLFENLECHMINEVRKRVAKESTLALSERSREEGALSTDLWKKPVMKESYTITRPHVVENFVEELMTDCWESGEEITFNRSHLYSSLASLARGVMGREKLAFESYSMYYENLLRVNHQLLYQREQEIKQMREQLKGSQHTASVDVQCQLATQAHDLLMEITALRAKIAEMREMLMTQERDVRDRIRSEYEDLVQNLFNCTFQLRGKFDEFKDVLYDDVFEKISQTRREAVEAISKLEKKVGGGGGDDERMNENLSQSEKLRSLQHENHTLNNLVLKMKTMTSWRQNHSTNNFLKTIGRLRNHADNSKKEYIEVKMMAEEEVILLRQQLMAVKKALADTEREGEDIKKQLDKELKMKLEKQHEIMQKERSKRQLEQAKQANIEKLLDELEDKEVRLRILSDEQERNVRLQSMTQEKVRKDVTCIKKQLTHERNLKLDAFQRVDELQATVYDYETVVNRSQSSAALQPPVPSAKIRSRAMSAGVTGRRPVVPGSRGTSAGGMWPPQITWPGNRSPTPVGDNLLNNLDYKKMQRPKTVGGRLRSRIAEQLLNEFESDHHQTIVQLEELQLGDGRP